MITIDSSFDTYTQKPSDFVLRLHKNTLSAEKKNIFTWFNANYTSCDKEYQLRKIIDTFRHTHQSLQNELVVAHLNLAIDRYNARHPASLIEFLEVQKSPLHLCLKESESAYIEDYVIKFLEPYLAGEIGPENEDKTRAPLIEKLYPEFAKKFPQSKVVKSTVEKVALEAYFLEAAKSLLREDLVSTEDLRVPYITGLPDNWSKKQEALKPIYAAIQHGLQIDFKGITFSKDALQYHLKEALKKASSLPDRTTLLPLPAKKPIPTPQQMQLVIVTLRNATQESIQVPIQVEKTIGALKSAVATTLNVKPEEIAVLVDQFVKPDETPLYSLDLKLLKWVMLPKPAKPRLAYEVKKGSPDAPKDSLLETMLQNHPYLSATILRNITRQFNLASRPRLDVHAIVIDKRDALRHKTSVPFRAVLPDSSDLLHQALTYEFVQQITLDGQLLEEGFTKQQIHSLTRHALNEYVRTEIASSLSS